MSITLDLLPSDLSPSKLPNQLFDQLFINGDRLQANIERLAQIGKQPNGQICRLAFTLEDLQSRYLVE